MSVQFNQRLTLAGGSMAKQCAGLRRAAQVIIIGDGAPWIQGIADEHFSGATQIVDLYHVREHLAALSKLVYGLGTSKAKHWSAAIALRCTQLRWRCEEFWETRAAS